MGSIDLFNIEFDLIPRDTGIYALYEQKHQQSDFKNNQHYKL
jgi:short subunit dehydrogenase-like uncharacterized protein